MCGPWEAILRRDPPKFESWYGYAQLCLFLGDESAYRHAHKALLYRFAADLPYADVAEALGTSEDAARQRVSEGIRRLRKAWQ